jgi:two-component system, NtrC family, sensor kinase
MCALPLPPRVLVVDDNEAIHADIRKILDATATDNSLDEMEADLFGESATPTVVAPQYRVDSAYQGQDGLAAVERAIAEGDPYAVAIVDVRMPPGWDGVETIVRMWEVCDRLQIVMCTAYSDYSWTDMLSRLARPDGLLILKKPFDPVELLQMANALSRKWALQSEDREKLARANAQLRQEIADRERAEGELRIAHKLEAVGRLASGVAHEINTPVQFVSNSVQFVRDAMQDITTMVSRYQTIQQAVLDGVSSADCAAEVAEAAADVDLPFLINEVPRALDRSAEGLERIARIVRSMKQFAHPDGAEMTTINLNDAIAATLEIARNEYKYVADLETSYGAVPPVLCHAGEIDQVILNLVVNAAHAVADANVGTENRGRIAVRTRLDGDAIEIDIEDNGCGIPDHVRDRIFDPFFTTKEVGRGTGQGLAIARNIVERHRGRMNVISAVGKGTTFTIRLPIASIEAAA